MSLAERLFVRLAGALASRSGQAFAFGAAEIMAARAAELKRVRRLPRAFSVRPAGPDDEAMLGAFIGNPAKAARLLSSGDVGLLALGDGQLHAMEWARLGPADYDEDERRLGVVFRVPARYAWLHNGSSGGGGGGVGPWAMILGWLPGFLEERGIDVVCNQVVSSNAYAIHCHESLGFGRVARLVAMRLWRWRLVALRVKGGRWVRFRQHELGLEGLAT
jgi:hypothetical protein